MCTSPGPRTDADASVRELQQRLETLRTEHQEAVQRGDAGDSRREAGGDRAVHQVGFSKGYGFFYRGFYCLNRGLNRGGF